MVKNPPAKQDTQVPSLDQKDLLRKEIATHSNILAWEISWTEEPGGLQSMGHRESDMTEQPNTRKAKGKAVTKGEGLK